MSYPNLVKLKCMEFLQHTNNRIWFEGWRCSSLQNSMGGQKLPQWLGPKIRQLYPSMRLFNHVHFAVNKSGSTSPSILQKPFYKTTDMNVMRPGEWGEHWLFGMQWFSGWTLACGRHYPTVKFSEAGRERGFREGGFLRFSSGFQAHSWIRVLKVWLLCFEALGATWSWSDDRNGNDDHPVWAEP